MATTVKIKINNQTGYELKHVKSVKGNGSISIKKESLTIKDGDTGVFTTKGSGGKGAQYKVYYEVAGFEPDPSIKPDPQIMIYVEDSVDNDNPHHVRVYPGENSPTYFFGDYNFSSDFRHCADSDADVQATITLEPPTIPDTFYVVSDLHFTPNTNENGSQIALANKLNKLIDENRRYHLGVIANGDLYNSGDTGAAAKFKECMYQEEKFDGKYRSKLIGPLYEGLGNHDQEEKADNRVRDRNKHFEGRRWMVTYDSEHYAWEWHEIRFIQLNVYPGMGKRIIEIKGAKDHKSLSYDSLDFLEQQLKDIGNKPYILCFHLGLKENDTTNNEWWLSKDRQEFKNVLDKYHKPLYIFTGHTHNNAGFYVWDKDQSIKCYDTSTCQIVKCKINADKTLTFETINV